MFIINMTTYEIKEITSDEYVEVARKAKASAFPVPSGWKWTADLYDDEWVKIVMELTKRAKSTVGTGHLKDLVARAFYDGIQKGKFGIVENGTTGALELAEKYADNIAAEQSVQQTAEDVPQEFSEFKKLIGLALEQFQKLRRR